MSAKAAHPALLAADWPGPPGVVAFTTLRHGAGASVAPYDHFNLGARCGDAPDAVAANRAALATVAGLPGPPAWLRQVHGTGVVRVDRAGTGVAEPEADAAVTDVPGVVLAILTADCLPVVFAARDGRAVGVAHAGWRGLAAGVLEQTLDALRVPPADVVAWLGPCAGPAAYEVGAEVRDAFLDRDAGADRAFAPTRPGHWRVDLPALARMRLQASGMDAGAIHGGTHCTISEPARFFSHRRDQRTGRMATVAWIDGRAGAVATTG